MEAALKSVFELSASGQRRVAVILGACIADAAARPTHWQYDVDKLKAQLGDRELNPEFFPENCSPFYSIATGLNSCYFDITKSSLRCLSNGEYSWSKVVQSMYSDFFGADSKYDPNIRSYSRHNGPVDGRWIEGSLLKFKDNRDKLSELPSEPIELGDADVTATDGFCAALPLIVSQAGPEDQDLKRVEEVIRILTNWPTAISHGLVAARIIYKLLSVELESETTLKQVLEGISSECKDKFPDACENIQDILTAFSKKEHKEAVGILGRHCGYPPSFQGSLHASMFSEDFITAVRKTILAGGCNCSRAVLVGAMFGARFGMKCLPRAWFDQCTDVEEVINNAVKLVKN